MSIYVGTDLKFAIDIQCEGFDMREDDFHIVLKNIVRTLEIDKGDLVYDDEEDTWYLCFNSEDIGAGDIIMVVYAEVPDTDFADGRTEVYKCTLCRIESA